MRKLLAFLAFALAFVSLPAAAQDDRGSGFFCIASDDAARVYLHTATFETDPNVSSEDYMASFNSYLAAQGAGVSGICTFTHVPQNIPLYLDGLRQQCDDCAIYGLRQVGWTPAALAAAPAESGAGFPVRASALDGSPACSMMNEGNYREAALAEGPDQQLRALCGAAFEYYTMYKRAIEQGYSEADANRTYDAHQQAALVAISHYEDTKVN